MSYLSQATSPALKCPKITFTLPVVHNSLSKTTVPHEVFILPFAKYNVFNYDYLTILQKSHLNSKHLCELLHGWNWVCKSITYLCSIYMKS